MNSEHVRGERFLKVRLIASYGLLRWSTMANLSGLGINDIVKSSNEVIALLDP
jgi:hypothetical protein